MSWKKGQSGNPRGRPKRGQTFADEIRRQAQLRDPESRKTARQRLVARLFADAIEGDVAAARTLLEWSDGKPAAIQIGIQSDDAKLYVTISPDDWDDDASIPATTVADTRLEE